RRTRRDQPLHHPRLRVQSRRCPAHELPPAEVHPAHARQRLRQPRPHPRSLSPSRGRALPLLQLRRLHVDSLIPKAAQVLPLPNLPPYPFGTIQLLAFNHATQSSGVCANSSASPNASNFSSSNCFT